MASMLLKEQLNDLVNSMFREGLLDEQFTQLQMLQDANNPGFVAEVIALFCDDSERILAELTKSLEQAVVDYQKADAYVHQLKGSSSSVGAQRIKLACVEFRHFCEENNREGCLQALHGLKHEYFNLRSKFEAMVQMEQKISAIDAKQQK
ncbi:histidine-containing phosphotransfer protein 2-like [Tasmannia lanceolata]|uniref:histidine-containing phosphotransfer protein 2-like n=1 Tax=Tasmannia lanceolata TaxID=3420 RepID=UPI004063973D